MFPAASSIGESLPASVKRKTQSYRNTSTTTIRNQAFADEDVIRVYFSDGAFKSLKINRNTTADEVCLMFARKIRLERFKKKFQLKEKTPTVDRVIDWGEKVWDIKKEWERSGFSVSLDEKWKFMFTFTEEASRALVRRTLQLYNERTGSDADITTADRPQIEPGHLPHPGIPGLNRQPKPMPGLFNRPPGHPNAGPTPAPANATAATAAARRPVPTPPQPIPKPGPSQSSSSTGGANNTSPRNSNNTSPRNNTPLSTPLSPRGAAGGGGSAPAGGRPAERPRASTGRGGNDNSVHKRGNRPATCYGQSGALVSISPPSTSAPAQLALPNRTPPRAPTPGNGRDLSKSPPDASVVSPRKGGSLIQQGHSNMSGPKPGPSSGQPQGNKKLPPLPPGSAATAAASPLTPPNRPPPIRPPRTQQQQSVDDLPAPPNWDLPSPGGPPGPAPPPDNIHVYEEPGGEDGDYPMEPPPPEPDGTDEELADLLINADLQKRQMTRDEGSWTFNLDSALSALAEVTGFGRPG